MHFDVVVHQEDDEAFHVGLGKTRSKAWLLIAMHSMVTSEVRVVPAGAPTSEPRLVAARRQDIEYDVEHHRGRFLIVTNDNAVNFKLVEAPVEDPGPEKWRDAVAVKVSPATVAVSAQSSSMIRSGSMPQRSRCAPTPRGTRKGIRRTEASRRIVRMSRWS